MVRSPARSVPGGRALALVLGAGLLLGLAPPPGLEAPAEAQSVAAPRPNVLVIVTDDQRIGTFKRMPVTRKWFRRGGTRFTNAFATTPLCCPSRATIFTGRYSHNTGVRTNDDAPLLDQRSTVQRYLREEGYTTAIVGKYLNRWKANPPHFDEWRTFHGAAKYRKATINANGVLRTVNRYSTDYVAAQAARLVRNFESQDERPWFLYVAPFAPHSPYHPAWKYRKATVKRWKGNLATRETDRSDKPPWVRAKTARDRKAQRIRAGQLRTQLSVDDLVQKIFRAMQNQGEVQETLAVFLSDHGLLWGEHGLLQKQSPYRASVRIPLFLRWPGRVSRGVADDRAVATVDVAPTIMHAAGVTPDPEVPVDGRSLLQGWERDRMLLEFTKRVTKQVPTWASTWSEEFQYVEYYDEATGVVTFREWYDLVNDPWQLDNLLGDGDPTNDPPQDALALASARLARDRSCRGTVGAEACP